MKHVSDSINGVLHQRDMMIGSLASIEGDILTAVADQDDMLDDRDIDAIALASSAAAKLFTLAHDLAFGLVVNSPVAQETVQEVLAELSTLTDVTFASDEEDDEELA